MLHGGPTLSEPMVKPPFLDSSSKLSSIAQTFRFLQDRDNYVRKNGSAFRTIIAI